MILRRIVPSTAAQRRRRGLEAAEQRAVSACFSERAAATERELAAFVRAMQQQAERSGAGQAPAAARAAALQRRGAPLEPAWNGVG